MTVGAVPERPKTSSGPFANQYHPERAAIPARPLMLRLFFASLACGSLWYSLFAIRELRMTQPTLRPQDVLVLAKLLSCASPRPAMSQIGLELQISPSEVHAALKRLATSRLVSSDIEARPLLKPAEEFLVHALKYVFPAKRGEVTRGVLTSYAAPPLNRLIEPSVELPPVWPFPEGHDRGVSLAPLYKTVPAVALRDPALYEFLALLDGLREGRAREREIAERELRARIQHSRHA